jgi:hypothetical protein
VSVNPGDPPSPTGNTVYIPSLDKLQQFKVGDAYVIEVPVVFNNLGALDLDCRLQVNNDGGATSAGSVCGSCGGLHGWLTSSTVAGPLITLTGNAYVEGLQIRSVAHAFAADGSSLGDLAVGNFSKIIVIGAAAIGSWANYSSVIAGEAAFFACGGLTLQAIASTVWRQTRFGTAPTAALGGLGPALGSLVLDGEQSSAGFELVEFTPGAGVTALSVPATASYVATVDIRSCNFKLDDASSVGVDFSDAATVPLEGFRMKDVTFTTSSGGAPTGTPIPASGALNGTSPGARFTDCDNIDNSVNLAYIVLDTPAATITPTTPTKLAGTTTAVKLFRFEMPVDNRARFIGATSGEYEADALVGLSGSSNETITLYIAVGDDSTPAAIAPESAAVVPLGPGGSAGASAAVRHVFKEEAGAGTFVEVWGSVPNGNITMTSLNWRTSHQPA